LILLLWAWFVFRYFPRKEASESRRLEELYGAHFVEYRSAVPALWPRLRGWQSGHIEGDESGWMLDRYSDNNELGTLLAILAGVLVFWIRAAANG
jgi:hypothetical protein